MTMQTNELICSGCSMYGSCKGLDSTLADVVHCLLVRDAMGSETFRKMGNHRDLAFARTTDFERHYDAVRNTCAFIRK